MSREQESDALRRLRAELDNYQRLHYGLNTKTISSSSYQDTGQRSTRGNLDISSHRSIRDAAANMPIFLDDTHKSNILSRDYNSGYDSNIQPSNIRSHTTPVSAALEALQTYGPVTQSPSHSSVQRDLNAAFSKNMNNPPEKLKAFLSSVLKSKDSNIQTYSESSTMSTSDISCPPFNDLNLNNVDEEDEYLYGDSNSLPEIPQLLKNDSDQSKVKTDRPMWSDEEDLFGESSATSQNKSDMDQMKSSNVWSLRNKNIQLNLSQKLEESTRDSNRNMPRETYSVEQQHSSVSSAECQNVRNMLNKFPEKDVKNIMSEKDSTITSTSSVKSKYHVAAQVLKKKIAEKSNFFSSETRDFPSSYPADMKNNSMSFKNDIQENKVMTKSNIPIKDSKELKVRKSGENVRRLPKAFLQKDLNTIADYIKPQRKRMHAREEVEYVKHPRHENYRNVSPNRDQPPHQSSRHRSPVDEHRHRSPYHSRHRSPEGDLRYKISHHFKSKSPHRDYDRHSYEYNARHNEGRWHSPSRKSAEQSTRHYNYRARSPRSYRSRERSRSPGSFRPRERSRSPESFRSRERSRSPGYHRSGDRSHEREFKKDSYKSKELSKGETRDSESRNRKKAQNYSSDDSLCTISLESESSSSDSSDDNQGKKEKSTTKPITKEKKTDNTKSLKTDTCKTENKAIEDIFAKKPDKSVLPDNISSQNLAELCNFQDKTSEDPSMNEILKFFDKGNDKLSTIVKMFENSHLVRELVEGVQEHVNSLKHPTPPPDAAHNTLEHVNSVTHSVPSLDVAQNTPNLLTPSSFVPNVSYPSSEPYPIMHSVPIPFHPPPINSLPPLTFPPPPLVPPPVVPPPVMSLRVIPPPTVPPPTVPPPVSTSVYGPFPVSVPSVDVSRIPDIKQVKKRPTTLRPINITADIPSPSKSSKEHSQPPLVTAESKDKKIEKEKTASEAFSEQNHIFIETYKKLKTERHYAHVKVNSCVADLLEMRKIMDDTWGKKENPSDRVFYSRCKNMISASSNAMQECVKEARRLDNELNRFKGLAPKHILAELGNIKIEEPPKYGNVHYSCFDTSNHTCYLCCKPFPNLLGILEHLHSAEHKEQMTANDKDWTKKFKKPEKNKDDKNVVLQPVQGLEFMKPFTGYFCSLCSEALLDKTSAEQHLKSHDHYCQYKDYNSKNPIYEKKIFFKTFIQRSILSKAKEKRRMQEKEQQLKKAEEANEKVKDALRDQKSKEKIVEDLEEDDADPLSSKSQSSSGIKLNLSNDKEKDKQNVKEGSKAAKAPQRVVYIGKAPNFKARKPWYKKDIYQKNDESSSQSTEPTLPPIPVVTLSKQKNSGNGRESSPSINPDSSGNDIPEALATRKKGKITSKKVLESTCLTEEDSKKLGTSSDNISLSCKEKSSKISNDPAVCSTEGESKNLNTNCGDLKNISNLSTENAQHVSGDSGSILNADACSKQSTSVQNTKDTHIQPGSPANENRDGTIAISKDSTVNQALKNILLGTDSSVQEIPLNEIQLPDTHGQNSSNTPTNSLLHGESNIPVPMEIEDTNDESVCNPQPKLTTEEDRDLYILGINREDLIPLVVPVPPPSSLLNCDSPAASSPNHSSENTVSKNANESKVIPASVSTDLNKSPKKTVECSNNNSKYSKNSSNLIILTDNTSKSESLLESNTEKTSIEFKNLITICETVESSVVNTNDVTAAVSTKSQDISIESSVDNTVTSKEDSIMQINETSLETTKAKSLETDGITEKSSQMSDASESNENLSEVVSTDKHKEKKPDSNLNLIEAVVQDSVTERSSLISEASNSNEHLNEITSSDNENLKKEPDINLNLIEDVAQDKIVNQIASATDCVIAKSEQADSDSISISKCESSDSSNMADCVEINAKSLVVKDTDKEAFSSSIKPHDINQNSDLEPAQKSADQNQVSSENNITDMEVCASTNQTISVKNELGDIESMQDIVLEQSSNRDSSNEVPGKEICESAHMQDQESNIKPCQSLIIKQESPKESISESYISRDILSDQQSNSDIKLHQNPEAKQLLNKVSVNEDTPDMEVTISENKADISQQCIKSDIEVVSDMEVCETNPEVDQSSNSKPNLNLACSDNLISPVESSKNANTETIDVVVDEKVSKQPSVHTEITLFEKKEDDEMITTPSSTDLPIEIISDVKLSSSIPESADINLTTSVNNSCDILDSHSSIIPEQCLSSNVCSPEVRMEIDSEQQAIFTENKSQCDVKSDQDLNLHSLNHNLVAENTDVTEELIQECHTLKKSNETVVEDKICDSMSEDSSHLISENLSENKSFDIDNKNLQSEPVKSECDSVKSECEVAPSEGVISQLSSNQCDSTSEKTASYVVDTNSPDESVNEVVSPVHVSLTRESVSEQQTTQQKLDVTLESIATVNKENEESVSDCNTSIISQMDEKQQAGSEINLKSSDLKENIAGDPESKTQILSSSSSGEVLETQNLAKSDTDTDEYENEE